jgi:peptidyl-prolyl isomerase D
MDGPRARGGGAGAAAASPAWAARRPRCFLDVTIGGRPAGRLVLELRPDVAPRTVRNFVALW